MELWYHETLIRAAQKASKRSEGEPFHSPFLFPILTRSPGAGLGAAQSRFWGLNLEGLHAADGQNLPGKTSGIDPASSATEKSAEPRVCEGSLPGR